MKLGVIGSGNIGKGVGSWAAKVGYDVTFSGKNEAGAKSAAQAAGHGAKAANVRGAVYGGTKWFVRDFMEVLRMESAQEGTNIRTTTIYPAAINTELLGTISHRDTAQGMGKLYEQYQISPDRVASVVALAIDQPEDTTISEFTVGPANQPW